MAVLFQKVIAWRVPRDTKVVPRRSLFIDVSSASVDITARKFLPTVARPALKETTVSLVQPLTANFRHYSSMSGTQIARKILRPPILSSSRNLYCREHGYTKMLQDPCDVKKQYISGSTSWYQAPRISGKSLPELKAENIPLRTRNTLYIVVATIVFLLIASHRFCCSCYKNLDLAFADKHYIEDTVSFLLFYFFLFLLFISIFTVSAFHTQND